MANFVKIADIDTGPLSVELQAASEMWHQDTSRQRKVRCQRHTHNIFLRAAKKPLPPNAKNANDVHESRIVRAAARFPRTLACCERIARGLEAELGRATLVALLPKMMVYPHVDTGAYYRIRDRYHLVLRSREGSPLTAGDDTVTMREGELWVFNNKTKHWANNPSSEPRIHLIFDVLPADGSGHFVYPLEEFDDAAAVMANSGRVPNTARSARSRWWHRS